MRPEVTIIICTRNRARHLKQTLDAMANLCLPQNAGTELLIVDNGSTDDTQRVVQECSLPNMPVRYIHEAQQGQTRARNSGIAAAYGDIILFTDDDVRPKENWVVKMCAPILSNQAHAVAGAICMADHLRRPWMQELHVKYLACFDALDNVAPHIMIGANMAFTKQVLSSVPGFDSELGPGALGLLDDYLFSAQVEAAGFPIAGAKDAIVVHHFEEERLTRQSFIQHAAKQGRSWAYMSHHWFHSSRIFPALRIMRSLCLVSQSKLKIQTWQQNQEGCSVSYLERIQALHFNKQFLIERKRKRNYDKFGLVKIK